MPAYPCLESPPFRGSAPLETCNLNVSPRSFPKTYFLLMNEPRVDIKREPPAHPMVARLVRFPRGFENARNTPAGQRWRAISRP